MGLDLLEQTCSVFNEIEAIIGKPAIPYSISNKNLKIPRVLSSYPHAQTICLWYIAKKSAAGKNLSQISRLELDSSLKIESFPDNFTPENFPNLNILAISDTQGSTTFVEQLCLFSIPSSISFKYNEPIKGFNQC